MNKSCDQTLSATERRDWLRLIRSDNVGPITFYKLLERFGSASASLEALPELARRGGGKKRIKVATLAAAEREIESLDKIGATLIARGEPNYPPLLGHIEDAPPLINALGHPHLLSKKAIAVVGARNASINGLGFAEKISRDLGAGSLLVVSGMARGIDAAAHRGALATGTVAVLGGGIDVVYPKENADLYDRLRDEGVIVSEIAPGTQPQARHFPRRNRLISGIARGVVVVEARPRSGSLITARLALEQDREVFAVP
ncbi:MAG: DNA-protecting protein DprA, partial [Alphaproteobacteria bacterium]|nr:DNA-protecting protein DprA [Alphaproteobacteria bacterium]